MNTKIVNAYKKARRIIEDLVGITPENYLISLFIDDSLFENTLLQTIYAGTPKSILSSNDLSLIKTMRDGKISPLGIDLFVGGKRSHGYFPGSRQDLPDEVLVAKFVQFLGLSVLCENTQSKYPDALEKMFRYDTIIHELFINNVYELVKERKAPWAWQYFQDFIATLRLLTRYDLVDFYIPPISLRESSIFYNFLLEIKEITKKRAEVERKAPLWDFTLYGFGHYILKTYLQTLPKQKQGYLTSLLKGNFWRSYGEIGADFIAWNTELDKFHEIPPFEIVKTFSNDYELLKSWNRSTTKKRMNTLREKLNQQAIFWHNYKEAYWSDLWPIRSNAFDKATNLVGKIQRSKFSKIVDLLNDKPITLYHGNVVVNGNQVAVFTINEDTVGLEQLLIIRNHLIAQKNEFATLLPGLPNIITFKKYAGMHIATYVGSHKFYGYPRSPYDIPLITRAIQVNKKGRTYMSQESEKNRSSRKKIDYSTLKNLTEPQYQAIRYLVKQKENA